MSSYCLYLHDNNRDKKHVACFIDSFGYIAF